MENNAPLPGDDQPLPHSMASKLAGWSAIAHQYPIFSKTWFAFRMRSFATPLGLLALILGLIALIAQPAVEESSFNLSLLAVWVVVALALSLGRGLAVLVRRRKWSPRREAAAIVFAMLFGVLVSLSLTPYTRTPQPSTPQEIERERETFVFNLVIWFPVLMWLGGTLDLVAYFRQRRLLREADLLEQVERYKNQRNEVEAQLSVLASQVEPHFLFNTLSGVRAAMLSDPSRGIVMIDHLIDYLRSTIPQLRADRAHMFVALGSQLDSVQAYFGIIQARMPRLSFHVDCPQELRGVAIPPLMLISLAENAVKHGIELKKGPATIRVTAVRTRQDLLELSVADDGVGFGTATTGSGIGLANIRERLKHLYGGEASLALRAGEAGGVVASITLPIRTMPEGN